MFFVSDIREEFRQMLQFKEFNDAGLLEIVGASFIADEDSIFGTPNMEYIDKEIKWYNSKSRNVYDMHNPPQIWKDIASKNGMINSNYGWCIFSEDNHRQYARVLQHLRDNPNTRQASMIYTRPTMHDDSIADGMKDFMCTNAVTYELRNGILSGVVQMRSNDAVFGYKNDFAWQRYVLSKLSKDLNVQPGHLVWQVASLHIYPRHFSLIQ
jgi:thymidylate synthase